MDRLAPKLAGERLSAYADGVRARRNGLPKTVNPYDHVLRVSQRREWDDGWDWSDQVEKR